MDVDKKCKVCESLQIAKGVAFSIFLFFLFNVYLLNMIKKRQQSKSGSIIDILIKILIDYIQTTSLVLKISSYWSDNISQLLVGLGILNEPNSFLVGMECYLGVFLTDITVFYKKLMLSTIISYLIPIWLYVISILLSRKRDQNGIGLNFYFATSIVIIFDLLQSPFINNFFSAFKCQEIDNTFVLIENPEQVCWTAEHQRLILIFIFPGLIIWMLVLPVTLAYKVWLRRRNNLGNLPDPYSYITFGYKQNYFYWDSILIFQKFILILFSTFIRENLLIQIVLIISSFLSLILQSFNRPYISAQINMVSILCKFALHTSIIFNSVVTMNSAIYYHILIIIFFGVFNMMFVLFWIKTFLAHSTKLVFSIKLFCKKCLGNSRVKISDTNLEKGFKHKKKIYNWKSKAQVQD